MRKIISGLFITLDGVVEAPGSPTLVRSMLEQGLLDEIQFMVCPVVLGVGKRLSPEGIGTKTLRFVDTKPFDTGMVLLSYQPTGQ